MRKVACVDRKKLPNSYMIDLLIKGEDENVVHKNISSIEFCDKHQVENDESKKQIIPYIILINRHDELAIYQRKGNENRLHGLWSAGFGGHIEHFEWDNTTSISSLFRRSAIRELKEEFSQSFDFPLTFHGIINEEQTRVGRTHLGLVYSAKVDPELFVPSDEIASLKWVSPNRLMEYQTELWSKMAVELIFKI